MDNAQLIHQDSGITDWYTPVPIIQAARSLMGGIDLDPASSEIANSREGVQIPRYYSEATNGLTRPWFGNVWLNHPFSRQNNPLWIDRVVDAWQRGEIEQACMICYASVNAQWFHPLLRFPQFFFLGRVGYERPDGTKAHGVTKDSVFTWLPPFTNVVHYAGKCEQIEKKLFAFGYEGSAK